MTTGTVRGEVKDQTGAIIPGAPLRSQIRTKDSRLKVEAPAFQFDTFWLAFTQ